MALQVVLHIYYILKYFSNSPVSYKKGWISIAHYVSISRFACGFVYFFLKFYQFLLQHFFVCVCIDIYVIIVASWCIDNMPIIMSLSFCLFSSSNTLILNFALSSVNMTSPPVWCLFSWHFISNTMFSTFLPVYLKCSWCRQNRIGPLQIQLDNLCLDWILQSIYIEHHYWYGWIKYAILLIVQYISLLLNFCSFFTPFSFSFVKWIFLWFHFILSFGFLNIFIWITFCSFFGNYNIHL